MREELLTSRILKIPEAVAKEFLKPDHPDFDDLVSAGMWGLACAVKKFDPTRLGRLGTPVEFSTYAFMHVRNRIHGANTGKIRRERKAHVVSLYDEVGRNESKRLDWIGEKDPSLTASEDAEAVAACMRKLKPLDRAIVRMRLVEGMPWSGIAGRLSVDRKTAISRCNKALERMRKAAKRFGCRRGKTVFADPSKRGKPSKENAAAGASRFCKERAQSRRAEGEIPRSKSLTYLADHAGLRLAGPFQNTALAFGHLGAPLPSRGRHPEATRMNAAAAAALGWELVRGPEAWALSKQKGYRVEWNPLYAGRHDR